MAKKLLQKLVGVLTILTLSFSSLVLAAPSAKVSAQRDCDANAVIYCGVSGLSELITKYRQNQGGNLHAIFAHFGIHSEAYFDEMMVGRVTKGGEVYVGNELVANGAVTAGRQNMPGSTKIPGVEAYMRPPSVSFRSESLPALVKMVYGQFHSAVILSCGNPVKASPVTRPKPQPKPAPKPQPKPKNPEIDIQKDVRASRADRDDTDDENGRNDDDDDSENNESSNDADDDDRSQERRDRRGSWRQQVTVDPGDTVEYRITVTNTGDTPLTAVEIQDSLPSDVSFDNAQLRGDAAAGDFMVNELVGDGVTLNVLEVGESVEIIFAVTVGQEADACDIPMRNIAFANAREVSEVSDDALIKVCQPEKPPVTKAVKQAPPAQKLPETGAVGAAAAFSIMTVLGLAMHKLKEFYAFLLR